MGDLGRLFFMIVLIAFCVLLEKTKIINVGWAILILFIGMFFLAMGDNSSDYYY